MGLIFAEIKSPFSPCIKTVINRRPDEKMHSHVDGLRSGCDFGSHLPPAQGNLSLPIHNLPNFDAREADITFAGAMVSCRGMLADTSSPLSAFHTR